MLFGTICKSFSVRSHRRFLVHFMTITMVSAILKKEQHRDQYLFAVIDLFSFV